MKTIDDISKIYENLFTEITTIIKGQDTIVRHLIISIFSGGHVLIEGVPGLGKTLLARTISRATNGDFKRIQFTPDLMPSDIIGTSVYNAETGSFEIKRGPVFTNILLADEINRSPAKTQSALLQALQEKQVTIDGTDFKLDHFFICLATQNPIEMEGTYPLPEAQVDRFLMKLNIDYPQLETEREILKAYRDGFDAEDIDTININKIVDKETITEIRETLSNVIVDDKIIDYITTMVEASRKYPGIENGSSPRGAISLFKTSKVNAVIEGRDFVIPDDVKALALPVLRHRIILDAEAEIEGNTHDSYMHQIIEHTEVPR